jgi:hypothetical protein
MAKIGTLELKGASGKSYSFTVYSSDTKWNDGIACVYYVSKRMAKQDGGGTHTPIYIGETEDIKARFSDHHKQDCFEEYGYNCISIHQESSSQSRLRIEADLLKAINAPCND